MRLIPLLLILLLSGCGFRAGHGFLMDNYSTITVPYADGDEDGYLTASISHELSRWNGLRYDREEGDLTLHVKRTSLQDRHVGFRFDRSKTGAVTDRLVPAEERIISEIEVVVVDNATNEVVVGPVILQAHSDFDHDYFTTMSGIGAFSLGQLTDQDVARETAIQNVDEKLAKEVVKLLEGWW